MNTKRYSNMFPMVKVTEVEDDEAPTVLIVDNNQMTIHRLRQIFHQREFLIEICEDGDKAVDEYIRLNPELVVMSLDIPSLDGHLAALEMREHGGDCRIIFTAPKRQAALAKDAAFSAGAVAWLEKPLSSKTFDEIWPQVLGPIPNAPGLDDLDILYPEGDLLKITVEEDAPLDLPMPIINTEELPISVPILAPKDKRSSKKKLFFVLLIFGIAASIYFSPELQNIFI